MIGAQPRTTALVRCSRPLNLGRSERPVKAIRPLSLNRIDWTNHSHSGISWRILQAPMIVLNYLIAHELAHIVEPNHSREFWNLERNQGWCALLRFAQGRRSLLAASA